MHVARIEIRNVKGFGEGDDAVDLDLTDEGRRKDLAGWTVFAGANGSGKTTLLQAVALGLDNSTKASAVVYERLSDWVHGQCASGSLLLGLDRIKLSHESADERAGVLRGRRHEVRMEWRRDQTWSLDPRDLGELQPDAPRKFPHFVACYGPTRRVVGRLDDTGTFAQSRARVSAGLFREDAYLAESVQWLRDLDYRRLAGDAGAERLLQNIIALLNDGLLPGDFVVLGVQPNGLRVRHRGTELSLQSLSDGYRTTAALLVDLVMQIAASCDDQLRIEVRPDGRVIVLHVGVVLIDEMELHLHPSWQKQIGFWLKEHFPYVQFLVTTHSPFICQAADTLVRLSPPGSGRPVAEVVDEATYRRVVAGGADDAVVSSLFGLEYPHSEQAEQARARLAVLEVKDYDGTLSEAERVELERLRQEAPYTPTATLERILRRVEAAR